MCESRVCQNCPGCPIYFEQDYPGIHVYEHNHDFDPKIENFGIGDLEMGNWNLSSRDLCRDLWVVKGLS